MLIFVRETRETCCMLMFLFEKLKHRFSPREEYFSHGTCCVLIFVRGTHLRADFCL